MDETRRDVLRSVVALGGWLFLPAACRPAPTPAPTPGPTPAPHGDPMPITSTEYTLPKLPYAYDALEPVIDAQTMHLHHDLHHKAYVDGANEARHALEAARESGDFKQVDYWEHKLAFHGSGHLLHSLLWETMAPPGHGGAPSPALAAAVRASFGSLDKLRGQFLAAAKSVEGNGWAVLAYSVNDAALVVLQVENHQKQTLWSAIPLLACDVWEHAYYLKYQNRRAEFAQAWWGIVNWNDVSARHATASALRAGR